MDTWLVCAGHGTELEKFSDALLRTPAQVIKLIVLAAKHPGIRPDTILLRGTPAVTYTF